MIVFVLIGCRDGVPYEDPGAEEMISIHATPRSAEVARLERDVKRNGKMFDSDGYNSVEIREVEVSQASAGLGTTKLVLSEVSSPCMARNPALWERLARALAHIANRQDIGDGRRCWCVDGACVAGKTWASKCVCLDALLKEAGL